MLIKHWHADDFSETGPQVPFREELLASLPCRSAGASGFVMFASLVGVKHHVIILHGSLSS